MAKAAWRKNSYSVLGDVTGLFGKIAFIFIRLQMLIQGNQTNTVHVSSEEINYRMKVFLSKTESLNTRIFSTSCDNPSQQHPRDLCTQSLPGICKQGTWWLLCLCIYTYQKVYHYTLSGLCLAHTHPSSVFSVTLQKFDFSSMLQSSFPSSHGRDSQPQISAPFSKT